jgi:hypothetical protein
VKPDSNEGAPEVSREPSQTGSEQPAAAGDQESHEQPPSNAQAGSLVPDADTSDADEEEGALDILRDILLDEERTRLETEIDSLKAEIVQLKGQLADRDALAATIAPVLGGAIRKQIRESREEMIDALYPIIGQLVVRAVSEAVRDLARAIDARLRTAMDAKNVWRRIRAWIAGVPEAELALREALPFNIAELFVIHRETGLLLWHTSQDPVIAHDSELISAMLTAIQDFAGHALGSGDQDGRLDELQYDNRLIILEAGRWSYVAVVVDGIPPLDFRSDLRRRILEFDHANEETLRAFDGNTTVVAQLAFELFQPLVAQPLTDSQMKP